MNDPIRLLALRRDKPVTVESAENAVQRIMNPETARALAQALSLSGRIEPVPFFVLPLAASHFAQQCALFDRLLLERRLALHGFVLIERTDSFGSRGWSEGDSFNRIVDSVHFVRG